MKRLLFFLAVVALVFGTFAPEMAMPVNAAQIAKEKRIPFKITAKIIRFKPRSMVVLVESSEKGANDYVGRTVTVSISKETIIAIKTNTDTKYIARKKLKLGDVVVIKGNIRETGIFVAQYILLDRRTKK
jgi:hypothetical protein